MREKKTPATVCEAAFQSVHPVTWRLELLCVFFVLPPPTFLLLLLFLLFPASPPPQITNSTTCRVLHLELLDLTISMILISLEAALQCFVGFKSLYSNVDSKIQCLIYSLQRLSDHCVLIVILLMEPTCMTSHFHLLMGVCHFLDNRLILSRLFWVFLQAAVVRAISSHSCVVGRLGYRGCEASFQALISCKKSMAATIDLCGAPLVSRSRSEFWSLSNSRCSLPLHRPLIHNIRFIPLPADRSMLSRHSCGALSKSFWRSKMITYLAWRKSNRFVREKRLFLTTLCVLMMILLSWNLTSLPLIIC